MMLLIFPTIIREKYFDLLMLSPFYYFKVKFAASIPCFAVFSHGKWDYKIYSGIKYKEIRDLDRYLFFVIDLVKGQQ